MQTNIRNSLSKSVAILLGLAIVFAVLVVASALVPDAFARQVMLSVGGAILGSGLTFFLISAFGTRE